MEASTSKYINGL